MKPKGILEPVVDVTWNLEETPVMPLNDEHCPGDGRCGFPIVWPWCR